jgi:hypothetical protein
VFISPLDKNDVFALFVDNIVDGKAFVTDMLDDNLIARGFGAVDTHVEDVIARSAAVHCKAVLAAYHGMFKALTSAFYLQINKSYVYITTL